VGVNRALFEHIYKKEEEDGLGAKYKPDFKKAQKNLPNDEKENQVYLGTYFPRSFKEAYTIFCDIFDFYSDNGIKFRDKINILDIGAGTGGATFGLLQAMAEKSKKLGLASKEIHIITVEGNKDAIKIQEKIHRFLEENDTAYKSLSVELVREEKVFGEQEASVKEDVIAFIDSIAKPGEIDIMLSFKALAEMMVTHDPPELDIDDLYKELLCKAEEILSPNGMLCLVETTQPYEYSNGEKTEETEEMEEYLPYYLSKGIQAFRKAQPNTPLRYVLPYCCAKNIDNCQRLFEPGAKTERGFRKNCFQQLQVPVLLGDFLEYIEDDSKITYRLFVKTELGDDSQATKTFKRMYEDACPFEYCQAWRSDREQFLRGTEFPPDPCYCRSRYGFGNPHIAKSFAESQFSLKNLPKETP
jgi:ubiquinone/menaquinone biosynthesis C-methylase UbiE